MTKRFAWRAIPRPVRIGLWSLLALVVIVVIGGAVLAFTFNPNSLKPRIIAAVKQETGRDLTLQGPIRLGLSLRPTLVVQGVSFANPPGYSRPQMATLGELDLRLALLPLLHGRVDIARLDLIKPDIMLETDAQGRGNWQFAPPASTKAPAPATTTAPPEKTRAEISIAAVRIHDGVVTWRNDTTGRMSVFDIKRLQADAASPEAPLRLAVTASYDGAPVSLAGQVGPLTRLQNPAATTPWPVQLKLQLAGATLAVDGGITQPLQARGYNFKLIANVPDLTALAPFLPPQPALPPLHDVKLAAQITDKGGKLPAISDLSLHVGQSDLTQLAALKVNKLDVTASSLDQPVRLAGQGTFDNAPITLAGTVGVPAPLLSGGNLTAPIPIDVTLQALGSTLTVKGSAARTEDGRPSIQAALTSPMIDADRLVSALKKPGTTPAANGSPGTPPAKPAAKAQSIAETPIPFGMLRLANANVTLNVANLKSGGATYRAISAHLDLQNGKLNANPIKAELPEGPLDAAVTADANRKPPAISLRLRAPALAMQPLLAALHEPDYVNGNLEVQADLNGAGDTSQAIAASLDGTVGVGMANGTADNRLLGSMLGSILREVDALDLVGRGGTSQVRCFAARLALRHGVGTLRPLVLSSSLITMDGDGTVNLGTDTLDLTVRPQARIAGTGVVVPLRVQGPIRSPKTTPEPAGVVSQNAGTVAGAVLGSATPLGLLAGAVGGQKLFGGSTGVDCGAALAAARGQAAPAQPAAAAPKAPAAPAPRQTLPNIGNTLQQLFR